MTDLGDYLAKLARGEIEPDCVMQPNPIAFDDERLAGDDSVSEFTQVDRAVSAPPFTADTVWPASRSCTAAWS